MTNILWLDTETGGLDEERHSLLQVSCTITSANMCRTIDHLHLDVRPPDGVFSVTAKALDITRIDISQHSKTALPYDTAATRLESLLYRYGSRERLVCAGWNVQFDLGFVHRCLVPASYWWTYCRHVTLSVDSIAIAALLQGVIQPPQLSLCAVAEHLGIDTLGAHRAERDVQITIEVYQAILDLIRGRC